LTYDQNTERSEGSWYMPILTHKLVNTGRREGVEMAACCWTAPVSPAERAGSEGSYKCWLRRYGRAPF